MTDELTDYAVRWLKQRSSERPFLLYLSHKGVHGLYEPAPRHRDRYRDARVDLPTSAESADEVDGTPMWVLDQRNSWHGVEFPYHGRSGQTLAEMYRHYCEMILSIDDSVGRIVQAIEETNANDNTLVVFTSDGGHLWGEHGLIDKRCAYEESIRIPLLAHGPMVAGKSQCDALVANIDIAPTLLELAGLPVPDWMDGRSLVSLMQSPAEQGSWRQSLLYEYYWEPQFPQTPTTFCLRDKRFKLIQYHGIWDTDELYDLESDPRETRNLIRRPEHEARVANMRQELHATLKETDGLAIPLGFKQGHGSNERRAGGSKRAEFPDHLLRDVPDPP
jgi:N-acetylglucosamine-6-sulfatase